MNSANPGDADDATEVAMRQASKAAVEGRSGESDQLLARVAQLAPAHPAVLNELGVRMLQKGEAERARALFVRVTLADAGHPVLWSNMASSLTDSPPAASSGDRKPASYHVRTPKPFLDLRNVGAMVERVGCRRGPRRVRTEPIDADPGLLPVELENLIHAVGRQHGVRRCAPVVRNWLEEVCEGEGAMAGRLAVFGDSIKASRVQRNVSKLPAFSVDPRVFFAATFDLLGDSRTS